jgi:hypothetical protein
VDKADRAEVLEVRSTLPLGDQRDKRGVQPPEALISAKGHNRHSNEDILFDGCPAHTEELPREAVGPRRFICWHGLDSGLDLDLREEGLQLRKIHGGQAHSVQGEIMGPSPGPAQQVMEELRGQVLLINLLERSAIAIAQ